MNFDTLLVVVPHYGSDELLLPLMASLGIFSFDRELLSRRLSVLPFAYGEIVIINNNLDNVGFTKACNEGIRYGLEEGYKAVWLLNNDCEVVDLGAAVRDFFRELLDHPKTGVIGAKILMKSDPDMIHHAGTTTVFPAGLHKHGRVSAGDYGARTRERWVTGASFVIARSCLERIGMLDENFFNYASDSDYCFQARAAGFDVVYLPVPILHAVGQSAHPSPTQMQVLRRDMTYFAEKWLGGELFARLDSEFF